MNHSPDQLQALLDDLSPDDVRALVVLVGHDPEKPARLGVSPEGLIEVHQQGAGTTTKLASFYQLAAWPKGMPCAGYYPEDLKGPDQ